MKKVKGNTKELGYLLMGVGLIGLYCANNMRGNDLGKNMKKLGKQLNVTE